MLAYSQLELLDSGFRLIGRFASCFNSSVHFGTIATTDQQTDYNSNRQTDEKCDHCVPLFWWLSWESNPGPSRYEHAALPLSYTAVKQDSTPMPSGVQHLPHILGEQLP